MAKFQHAAPRGVDHWIHELKEGPSRFEMALFLFGPATSSMERDWIVPVTSQGSRRFTKIHGVTRSAS